MKALIAIILLSATLFACAESTPDLKHEQTGIVCDSGWVIGDEGTGYPALRVAADAETLLSKFKRRLEVPFPHEYVVKLMGHEAERAYFELYDFAIQCWMNERNAK